ncbi:MAG: ornithine carbamoyltransferase [Deltaproteobacteria bacterium]|nr:ornithine carbamoyltransferase [Deltaproteobacteria bacterium]
MNMITLKDFRAEDIESIIETSIRIKQNPSAFEALLKEKTLYMLFEKTSTRTAMAFGLGINELGGRYFFQRWQDSNFSIGDVVDETRYVARNVDIILARLKQNRDIEAMGECSPIPVINGCCNKYHPTQALADCMTVKETFGTYRKTLLYVGIWNNVFNSLINSFPKLGGKLIGVCPIVNESSVSPQDISGLVSKTANFEYYGGSEATPEKLKEIVKRSDIVYTDTWVDMEFFNNPEFKDLKEQRIKMMKPYALTADLLEGTGVAVMHDMPIHAGYEIEREVVEAHIDTILNQAENRRHVAKGIFLHLLGIEI